MVVVHASSGCLVFERLPAYPALLWENCKCTVMTGKFLLLYYCLYCSSNRQKLLLTQCVCVSFRHWWLFSGLVFNKLIMKWNYSLFLFFSPRLSSPPSLSHLISSFWGLHMNFQLAESKNPTLSFGEDLISLQSQTQNRPRVSGGYSSLLHTKKYLGKHLSVRKNAENTWIVNIIS